MNVGRGVLAASLVLSGLRAVGAEPCAPRASLEGDAEAITRVGAELVRLGVAIDGAAPGSATAGCRTISAAVELDRSGGIAVSVRGASHRSEGRVVGDAALAAAWIDSWLRDDFAAPVIPPDATVVAPPGAAPLHADVVAPVASETSPLDRISLAAAYESAWTETGARASGVGAAACMRVGELCFGARARYLAGSEIDQLTEAQRSDVAVLATASWSRDLGQMSFAPELGVGLGRLATSRVDGCKPPPPCDPTLGPCPPPPPPCAAGTTSDAIYVGDGFQTATYTPRVEAALRIAVPLFAHVWLDGTASVTLAPWGHSDPYMPTTNPPGVPAEQIALPGDPIASFALGVGVRVGAR